MNVCVGIALVIAVAAWSPMADAQQHDPSTIESNLGVPKEAAPAFGQTQVEAWRDEVIDDVAAVAKREFKRVPKIVVVTRDELLAAWERELRAEFGNQAQSDEGARTIAIGMVDKAMQAPFIFARYNHVDETIQVLPGNAAPLLALMKLEGEPQSDILKLVIAHELGHALHDQYVEFGIAYKARTEDEHRALDAMMEGFAMLVQARVAERLGLSGLNEKLVRASTLDATKMESAAAFGRRYNEIYIAGLRFMQHHSDGGMERVWAILADPPRTYAHITQPNRYGEVVAREIDKGRLFAGIDEILDAADSTPTMVTVQGESTASSFAPLGDERSKTIAATIQRAHTCLFRAGANVRGVTCYELGSAADAAALCRSIEALFDAQFGKLGDALREKGAAVTKTRVEFGVAPEQGFLPRLDVTEKQSDRPLMMAVSAVPHGGIVVQVTLAGSVLADDVPERATKLVLERLDAGEGSVVIPAADATNPVISSLKRIKPMLGAGEWKESIQPYAKSTVEKQLGDDIKGYVALEMGWQDGQSVMLEATSDPRASRRMLMVAVLRFSGEDAAARVGEALRKNLPAAFEPLRQMVPDVKPGKIVTTTLSDGAPCASCETVVSFKGETMRLRFSVVQRGAHVVYIADTNGTLGEGRIGELCAMLVGE